MGVGDMHNTGRGMERDIRVVFSMYPNSIRVSVRVRMYWSCPVSHLFTSSPRVPSRASRERARQAMATVQVRP